MMLHRTLRICGYLSVLALAVGCMSEYRMPNDAVKAQERDRHERSAPRATELPPGLGPDVIVPDTQPMPKDK